MLVYDAILSETTEEDALDYARGMVWCEIEATEQEIKYSSYVDTIGGVGVWYDYSADYFFFTEEITA